MTISHAHMLSVASKAAITAGELLRGVFFDHDRAADAVENADIAAEDLIYEALCREFPTMGFRMEERPERNQRQPLAVNTPGS